MDANAFYPPGIRLQDFKFQAAGVLDDFTTRRNASAHFKNQAAKRVGFEKIRLNAVAIKGITEPEVVPLANFAREQGMVLLVLDHKETPV
jgi:hypothetical protein